MENVTSNLYCREESTKYSRDIFSYFPGCVFKWNVPKGHLTHFSDDDIGSAAVSAEICFSFCVLYLFNDKP